MDIRSASWGALLMAALPATALHAADVIDPQPAAQAEVPATEPETLAATDPAPLDTVPVPPSDPKPVTSAAPTSTNRLVEEVVVTAQKREEKLQDVPISVQAFSEKKLEVLGLQSVQDVQRATPGFTVTSAASFNIVFLRGVGSDAYLPCVDSSVPFYIDGVPLLGIQGTADTLGRVQRVEVLKGPQGTLFGRNATGGAISIITPDPDQVFSGDVKFEIGNYNTRNVVAYINVPVTDSIAFNLSGFDNERDNIIHNDNPNWGEPPIYARGGRMKLRWNIFEQLALTLNGSYQSISNNGGLAFQLVRPAPVLSAGGLILPPDPKLDHHLNMDGDFGAQNEAYIVGGTLEWNADTFDSKLIYAHQRVRSPRVDGHFDGTYTPVASAHGGGNGARQFVAQNTAELQVLSNAQTPFSDTVEWVGGLFFLKSTGGFDPIVFEVAPNALSSLLTIGGLPGAGAPIAAAIDNVLAQVNLPPILGGDGIQLANYGLIDSKSYSAYAQATTHLAQTIDLTTGVRYQDEKRRLLNSHTSYLLSDGTQVELPLPEGGKDPLHAKQTSFRGALQWRPFGPNDQIYLSYARAYKSPTYNTVNLLGNLVGTMVPLKAERVDTAELGIKSLLLDGNLQLNTAAFYTWQKDPLSSNVSIPSGGVANFTNAGEAVIKGVDGDFLLIPMPNLDSGLVFTGSFSYLDAVYTDFKNGRGYDDATGLGFGNGGANLPPRDLSGKRIPRVPRWSYQLGLSQRIDLAGGDAIELGADTFFSSKMYFLPQNSELSKRDPLHTYNARASYFYTPWNVELTAYVNNITNKIYVDSAFVTDFGTALMANEDPRMYGLRVKVKF